MRRYAEVDVFAESALEGNPLAVIVDAEGLTTERMQAIATWTNFSETTFLLPATDPAADYRVRIFTPTTELPFAGHPTLGSAAVWLDHDGTPAVPGRIVQGEAAAAVRFAAYAVVRDQDDPYAQAISSLVEHSHELEQTVQTLRARLDRIEAGLAASESAGERLRAVK